MTPVLFACILLVTLLQYQATASPVDYADLEAVLRDLLRSEAAGRFERVQRSQGEVDPAMNPLLEAGLQAAPLRVAAFNIQIFGANKLNRPGVKDALIQILGRYDLTLIQEIRDSKPSTFRNFFNELKEAHGPDLKFTLSRRLGRSSSKEQYAYIYKPSRLTLKETYQSNDMGQSGKSGFERPPFCALFRATDSAIEDFGVIGIHTKPSDADGEIDRLTDVYGIVSGQFGTENIIMMGDFNAGCSYVTAQEWPKIRLRSDSKFTWLIGDDVDTTVANSDCAYDRFVIAGPGLKAAVVKGSAKPYRFDLAQAMDEEMTESVSDHYPIELEIYGKVDAQVTAAQTRTSFTIKSPVAAVVNMQDLVQNQKKTYRYFAYLTPSVHTMDGQLVVHLTRNTDCSKVVGYIQRLGKQRSEIMSAVVVALVKTYMVSENLLVDAVIPGMVEKVAPKAQCEVTVMYRGNNYEVKVSKKAQG